MSQIDKYNKRFDCMLLEPDGKYVLHSDYAALAAENERLRKAGDAMASALAFEYMDSPKVADWHAAKEGR